MHKADIFQIAAHGAVKQVRKHTGEPYHVHPQRVARLLSLYVPWATPDMHDAALLHDVVEDTGIELGIIAEVFNPTVARYVDGLTNKKACWPDGTPKFKRAAQKRYDAERLKGELIEVKAIKVCDVYDNTSDIIVTDPKFAPVFVGEKRFLLDYALAEVKDVIWSMTDGVIKKFYADNPQHA